MRLIDPRQTGDSGHLVLESWAYDLAGRVAQHTDALGRTAVTDYYGDDLVKSRTLRQFHDPGGGTRDFVLERNTYDAAGNLTTQVTGNGKTTQGYDYDRAGRLTAVRENPGGSPRTTTYGYDLGGNLTRVTVTGAESNVPWPATTRTETATYTYDTAGRQTTETVDLGGGLTAVTRQTYDQRDNVTSVTAPRGTVADPAAHTTNFGYDELGRLTSATGPPAVAETFGEQPATVRAGVAAGYGTFGELTHVRDPRGAVRAVEYDKRGLPVRVSGPAYTPPGESAITPATTYAYDAAGRLTAVTDARGFTTRYGYDRLGRPATVDTPGASDAERAIIRFSYYDNGLLASVTDPAGAVTKATYDDLDRRVTLTQLERAPEPGTFTTTSRYDDAGNVIETVAPSGATTRTGYDPFGQPVTVTDPNGVRTSYGYDAAGNQVRITDGLGRTTRSTYDLGGRLTGEADLDAALRQLRARAYAYDVAGNLVSATPSDGPATTFDHDAYGRLTRQVEPVADGSSITTSFGYDVAGDRTRYTDGRGNTTFHTVNTLGLPESVIEPATEAHPALADRTWTTGYDAAGNPVRERMPGGVVRERTFDAAGRLTAETGTGPDTGDASRQLTYDVAGRLIRAGGDTFTYDDRGHQLSASGPSGTATFRYDADGNLVRRADASGTADFTYVNGRLTTEADAVSRNRLTYGYDPAGRVATIDYGSGQRRTYGYDALGRVTTDALSNPGGATVMSATYGYDADDNVTSKATTGLPGPAGNTYTYDHLDRLTSWTADGTRTDYGWDAAGNRTRAGTATATYDAQNRLAADGTSTYAYTARGTLATKTTGGQARRYTFDAFDRMTAGDAVTYTYDDQDRLASANGNPFSYAGMDADVVADGTQKYGRGATGEILAAGTANGVRSLVTDRHGDVVGGFDPAAGAQPALPDARGYDPFGTVTASRGTPPGVGFQGDWTDPRTGRVDMHARWYDPASGTFASRDTIDYAGGPSSLANKFSYGAANPVKYIDPTGHMVRPPDGGGGGGCVPGEHPGCDGGDPGWHPGGGGLAPPWHGGGGGGSGGGGSSSGGGSGGSGAGNGGGHNGLSAAEKARRAHAAATRRSDAARERIRDRVRDHPLPTPPGAKTRNFAGGKQVSATSNAPAKKVADSANIVNDMKRAVRDLYEKAVSAAGPVVHELSRSQQEAGTGPHGPAPGERDSSGNFGDNGTKFRVVTNEEFKNWLHDHWTDLLAIAGFLVCLIPAVGWTACAALTLGIILVTFAWEFWGDENKRDEAVPNLVLNLVFFGFGTVLGRVLAKSFAFAAREVRFQPAKHARPKDHRARPDHARRPYGRPGYWQGEPSYGSETKGTFLTCGLMSFACELSKWDPFKPNPPDRGRTPRPTPGPRPTPP